MRPCAQDTQRFQLRENEADARRRSDLAHPSLTFELMPVAPFRLDFTAWALRRRPENQIDRWDGSTYRRVISIQGEPAEVRVTQEDPAEKPRLRVNVIGPRVGPSAKDEVDMLLTRMLGLQVDLKPFYRMASRDSKRRELAEKYRGLKPVRFPTIFETLANAISCQQFTITVGLQLLNRLGRLGNLALETEGGMVFGSPNPSDLLRLSPRTFRRVGFSRHKTRAFLELSRDILVNRLDLESLANLNNEDAINFLLRLRGVGRWTAEYALLRGLGRLDVFPGDDVGARNRLAKWLHRREPMDYASVQRALQGWRPYAGFVFFHMLMESLAAAGELHAGRVLGLSSS
jgi:DNA-3-methyladenine glycosylase II